MICTSHTRIMSDIILGATLYRCCEMAAYVNTHSISITITTSIDLSFPASVHTTLYLHASSSIPQYSITDRSTTLVDTLFVPLAGGKIPAPVIINHFGCPCSTLKFLVYALGCGVAYATQWLPSAAPSVFTYTALLDAAFMITLPCLPP